MEIENCILSVQRALCGHITPNLRAVYIYKKNDETELVSYFDKAPSENESELVSIAGTEFISDIPPHEKYPSERVVILPSPKRFPLGGWCVYKRYEPRSRVLHKNFHQLFEKCSSIISFFTNVFYKNSIIKKSKPEKLYEFVIPALNALLERVTPNLRCVCIYKKNDKFELVFYYNKDLSLEEKKLVKLVQVDFLSNFNNLENNISCCIEIVPEPNRFRDQEGRCVYMRYEPN